MKPTDVAYRLSPYSRIVLGIGWVEVEEFGEIKDGELAATNPGRRYPIRNFLARFIDGNSYTTSCGQQRNPFRLTQIDHFNGTTQSRDRFYRGTRWTSVKLRGQRVLEAGCGAGRSAEVLLDAGAKVYAVDSSEAVDACWLNNGPHPRFCVVQGDFYVMTFQHDFFNKILCFGALQHTPAPTYISVSGKESQVILEWLEKRPFSFKVENILIYKLTKQ